MYDFIIIGAGPAGATLARLLDEKYKVLIVDKRNLNNNKTFSKEVCCGGLLAPDAQKMLAKLGLGLPKHVVVGPQMFSVQTIDLDTRLTKYYQRHYINIDREKFDRWLVSLLPFSVNCLFDTIFYDYKKVKEGYEVTLMNNGKKIKQRTKKIIGADGAISRVRNQLILKEEQPDEYISIQKWYKTNENSPHYISIFDKNITDFYSWGIQKEEYLLIGTAIPQNENANEKFNLLEQHLTDRGYDLSQMVKKTGTLIMRPRKLKHIQLGKKGVFLIGEAAGLISPSSAEGISYALKSALILSKVINQSDKNQLIRYKIQSRKLKYNILYKNIKVKIMYNSWLRKLIMMSGFLGMEKED